MKISYTKASTFPRNLIPLLKKRGLRITDDQRATSYLTNIGYFRLSAYLYPLLDTPKENHIYKSGVTFSEHRWVNLPNDANPDSNAPENAFYSVTTTSTDNNNEPTAPQTTVYFVFFRQKLFHFRL